MTKGDPREVEKGGCTDPSPTSRRPVHDFGRRKTVFQGTTDVSRRLQFVDGARKDGLRIDLLEREAIAQMRAIGFELLDCQLAGCGDENAGPTIESNGRFLHRLKGKRPRRYVSSFGVLRWKRYVYSRGEGQKIERTLVDEQLGLAALDFSYVVQDWLQRLWIKESFAEAWKSLATLLGVRVSVHSAEHMNRHMAAYAEGFRLSQPPPKLDEEAELLVYANDCKGVSLRRPLEERVRASHRRSKGEKANQKRMACVGVETDGGTPAVQRMCWIPAGSFKMGLLKSRKGRSEHEGPQHQVTVSRGFWMFDTPCTQQLWTAVMGVNPSNFVGDPRPVEQASWHDAQEFTNRLREQIGIQATLPTEAQREYSGRAGTETRYYFGDAITPSDACYDNSSERGTVDVGSR